MITASEALKISIESRETKFREEVHSINEIEDFIKLKAKKGEDAINLYLGTEQEQLLMSNGFMVFDVEVNSPISNNSIYVSSNIFWGELKSKAFD